MNLFVMWTESFGEALKTSNQLVFEGAHILDCSIIGRWSQVLAHFDKAPAEQSVTRLASIGGQKKAWIPNLKDSIVESYLSLSTSPVLDFILTIETAFIGDVFEFLQVLNLEKFPIVDLRLLRFMDPKSLLLLTGNKNNADELLVIIENLKSQGKIKFQFELILNVSLPIKELFHHSEV